MKLSSRKKLLIEAEFVLSKIREEVYSKNLNKKMISESFFKDLVKSLTSIIIDKYLKKRQSYYYKKIPYLVGMDLVNNKNLTIDKKYLNKLEILITKILDDIDSSPILHDAIKELEKQTVKIGLARLRLNNPTLYSKKRFGTEYNKIKKIYDDSVNEYNMILSNKVKKIIESILTLKKYKNFEQTVTSNLVQGLKGISKDDLDTIRKNYINVIAKRASEYVDKNKVDYYLNPSEEPRRDTE
jgi:hypothetical protein